MNYDRIHKTFGELQPEFDRLYKRKWFSCKPTRNTKKAKEAAKYIDKLVNTPEFKKKMLDYGVHLPIYGTSEGFNWED